MKSRHRYAGTGPARQLRTMQQDNPPPSQMPAPAEPHPYPCPPSNASSGLDIGNQSVTMASKKPLDYHDPRRDLWQCIGIDVRYPFDLILWLTSVARESRLPRRSPTDRRLR